MAGSSTNATLNAHEKRLEVSIGYVCVCGQRVVVYRLRARARNTLPPNMTVTCPNGHVAIFSAQQFALLDDWCDD